MDLSVVVKKSELRIRHEFEFRETRKKFSHKVVWASLRWLFDHCWRSLIQIAVLLTKNGRRRTFSSFKSYISIILTFYLLQINIGKFSFFFIPIRKDSRESVCFPKIGTCEPIKIFFTCFCCKSHTRTMVSVLEQITTIHRGLPYSNLLEKMSKIFY